MAYDTPDEEQAPAVPGSGGRVAWLGRARQAAWPPSGDALRYAVAFAAYIALGLVFKEVFLSWVWGVTFLVIAVWGIPALWRRLR